MQLFLVLQPSLGNFNEIFYKVFQLWHTLCNYSKSKLKVSLVVNNRVIVKEGLVVMTGPSFSFHLYRMMLFLSQVYLYRASEEVEVASELVLKEASVRLADVLRKVAEECE